MKDREQHFVDLILSRRQAEARTEAARELSACRARQLRDRGSAADSSGWWIDLSRISETHAKSFIVTIAADVADICRSPQAYAAFASSSGEFLDFLSHKFEDTYRKNRRFYNRDADTTPLPKVWSEARTGLELDIEIARRKFEARVTSIESAADVANNFQAELAPNAQPAIKRDKPFADEAAALIREGKAADRAKAIRRVKPAIIEGIDEANIEHAIRRAYDMHYDAQGFPLRRN